jgi:stress response protein YsnF
MGEDRTRTKLENAELVVPVVEERARITKEQVSTGKVRINTTCEILEEVAEAALEEEDLEVIRVPVDRVVTKVPLIRSIKNVTIIPVLEEVLIVEKKLVLREELHVRRHLRKTRVKVPVTLRKQRAVVERVNNSPTNEE